MANKLELTWVGKEEKIELEPRILIEDKQKSYGDSNSENMLIHGDNLLALKALEKQFAGKVKCVYIDPPYNANATGVPYDDNVEHSFWLNLMKSRLTILKKLLKDDGVIFINIDDNEQAYLTVIMDEIFGRANGFDKISIKTSSSQGGFGDVNPGLISNVENILVYVKNKEYKKQCFNEENMYIPKEYDENYKFIMNAIDKSDYTDINNLAYEELKIPKPYDANTWRKVKDIYGEAYKDVIYKVKSKIAMANKDRVFRTFNPNKPSEKLSNMLKESKKAENRNKILIDTDSKGEKRYVLNGEVILFYSKIFRKINNSDVPAKKLQTLWEDISWEGISKEGGVKLRNSKKPEKLMKRIIEISTQPNDIVLDSFLGSGTTCAVAQKLDRRYIGIELGEHCYSLCKSRLDNVINGEQSGISKEINWKGGGGYKFYELAPTLINLDAFGEAIINKDYNPEMLASAVALHEGFKYEPDEEVFWKQSKANENSYLYVTTKHLSKLDLNKINETMTEDEFLIIACTSYDEGIDKDNKNIRIKKIPEMLLNKCEFGKDNYNLNIINPPEYDEEMEDDE